MQPYVISFGMVAFLEASTDSFVAPMTVGGSSTQAGSASSMAELKQPVRQLRTSVEAGPSQGPLKIISVRWDCYRHCGHWLDCTFGIWILLRIWQRPVKLYLEQLVLEMFRFS